MKVHLEEKQMVIRGHFQNGVIVPDEPVSLPEGTSVRIEVVDLEPKKLKRRGGMWKGQVVIADDFDALPPELAEAFGVGS
jgi:predicted DNA-binding antitoxin AbrB/MazE fold protein